MDFLFMIFERIFNQLQIMGVNKLTGMYLLVQISFFVVLLLIYLIPGIKELVTVNRVRKELTVINEEQPENLNKAINEVFERAPKRSRYNMQWQKYYKRITQKEQDEKIKIEPYFGLDSMHEALDKRGVMDIGGGIHVSLGVLGTFIGLSVGLAELDLTNADELRTGVAGLIGGMKVAFYTSVLGVVLSIIWIFVDRLLSRKTEGIIDWHANEMNYLLNVDDEEIFLNRLEKITHEQADQMKTIFSDALEHVMQPFVQSVQQGNQQVTSSLTQVHSEIKEQSDISRQHLEYLKDQGQDVSTKIVDEISKSTSETIEQFVTMMDSSKTAQSEMFTGMSEIAKQLEASAASHQMMFDKTDKLVTMFSALSNEMDQTQTKYTTSFEHLGALSDDLRQMQVLQKDNVPLQQSIIEKNEQFMAKSDELVNSLIKLAQTQDQAQHETIETLVEKTNIVSERFEQLAATVQDSAEAQQKASVQTHYYVEKMGENLEAIQDITTPIEHAFESLGKLSNELTTMQNLQSGNVPLQQSIIEKNEQFMAKSDELVNSLIELTQTQDQAQRETIDILVEKTNIVSERFEQLASTVQDSAEAQQKASVQTNYYVEKMGENLEAIQGITTPIEHAFELLEKLSNDLTTMQNLQTQLIPQLTEWNEVTVSQTNEFQEFTKEQISHMTRQLDLTKGHWTIAADSFEKTREGLGSALKEFNRNIETSVTNTFQLFDTELVTVVNHFKLLSQEYETSQEEFADAVEILISKMDVLKQGTRI